MRYVSFTSWVLDTDTDTDTHTPYTKRLHGVGLPTLTALQLTCVHITHYSANVFDHELNLSVCFMHFLTVVEVPAPFITEL